MSVPLETEVQERIFYDRRITTVVDKDRDANHEALFRLKEHMDRENEMLRSAGDIYIILELSMGLRKFHCQILRSLIDNSTT